MTRRVLVPPTTDSPLHALELQPDAAVRIRYLLACTANKRSVIDLFSALRICDYLWPNHLRVLDRVPA